MTLTILTCPCLSHDCVSACLSSMILMFWEYPQIVFFPFTFYVITCGNVYCWRPPFYFVWQPPSYIFSFDCSNSWRQMLSQRDGWYALPCHVFLGIFHTAASQRIPNFQYHFVCFMNLYNLYGCTLSPVPHPFLLLPYPPISVTLYTLYVRV